MPSEASEPDDDEGGARQGACLDEHGIAAAQEEAVGAVGGLLGVTPGSATLLLRAFRWNQEDLLQRYVEDADGVCRAAGLPLPSQGSAPETSSVKVSKGVVCSICREAGCVSSSLGCGHVFCDGCWSRFLELKIADGDTRIGCPAHQCPLRVPEETVSRLCSPETSRRFTYFLRKSFVDDSRHAQRCPTPGCNLAVDTSAGGRFFVCSDGHSFCADCKHAEAHAPAPCDVVRTWLKKCDDDSETYNWLSVNTQDCPQCKSVIEKNGGCNHMTCKQCKFEYCWVCLGAWAKHDNFYSCNRFDPDAAKAKESNKASTRAALDRYLFHFHRYINHDNSRKMEESTRKQAALKVRALQEASGPGRAAWGDVSFVQAGSEEAIKCRAVLKWTYVLAYALQDGSPQKELFCFLQQDLESRTERLSGLLEQEVEKLMEPEVRAEILAITGVAAGARKKLLRGAPDLEGHPGAGPSDDAAAAPPEALAAE